MEGRVAFVTGGASGIGRAISGALVARGDRVVVADINASGAAALARELEGRGPGSATSVSLDVTDPRGFEQAVAGAKAEHGSLDLLFNNAGIGVGGPVEELALAHWERTLDVNLRGVVHGVRAAYPLMIDQGFGHIVNTASLAGLLPFPLGVPYAMTKHAVVGLSVSLRAEARTHGVRVSAVCPGVIDTPILDGEGPPDLPPTRLAGRGREMFMHSNRGSAYPPQRLAEDVLRGVERDHAIIVAPARARTAWLLNRIAPRLLERMMARELEWTRTQLLADSKP
ncbi:MAG TPA: SDR family oxidoreductase [Solirubrobacteraceae bacterium]|jgi:NAD(P)-dependent dehydrogenase (short-subunit alcohol dehydrogenase family)